MLALGLSHCSRWLIARVGLIARVKCLLLLAFLLLALLLALIARAGVFGLIARVKSLLALGLMLARGLEGDGFSKNPWVLRPIFRARIMAPIFTLFPVVAT